MKRSRKIAAPVVFALAMWATPASALADSSTLFPSVGVSIANADVLSAHAGGAFIWGPEASDRIGLVALTASAGTGGAGAALGGGVCITTHVIPGCGFGVIARARMIRTFGMSSWTPAWYRGGEVDLVFAIAQLGIGVFWPTEPQAHGAHALIRFGIGIN